MCKYMHNERWRALHRAEDTYVIADLLRQRKPAHVIELGTHLGGLAALFADTVAPWGGTVHSFDIERIFEPALLEACKNLTFYQEDVLTESPRIIELVRQPGVILYTDNGDKERELANYAPHLAIGNLIGTHDYDSEVRPAFVEPLLCSLGYVPHWRETFEALAAPPHYPISMTRFWERTQKAGAREGSG